MVLSSENKNVACTPSKTAVYCKPLATNACVPDGSKYQPQQVTSKKFLPGDCEFLHLVFFRKAPTVSAVERSSWFQERTLDRKLSIGSATRAQSAQESLLPTRASIASTESRAKQQLIRLMKIERRVFFQIRDGEPPRRNQLAIRISPDPEPYVAASRQCAD